MLNGGALPICENIGSAIASLDAFAAYRLRGKEATLSADGRGTARRLRTPRQQPGSQNRKFRGRDPPSVRARRYRGQKPPASSGRFWVEQPVPTRPR